MIGRKHLEGAIFQSEPDRFLSSFIARRWRATEHRAIHARFIQILLRQEEILRAGFTIDFQPPVAGIKDRFRCFRLRYMDYQDFCVDQASQIDGPAGRFTFGDAGVTDGMAVLTLMGPRARDVLTQLTDSDISNKAFPFATVSEIEVEGVSVLALRVTYVGELGWELHLDAHDANVVYDALMAAGAEYGIKNAGYRAIESLRLEKGYRAWGSDINTDHTPLEAGLRWAVKLQTELEFKGRQALEAQESTGPPSRLACLTVNDPDVVLLGRETIHRDGERAGWLSSGGWGYTVDCNIGYGYVQSPGGVDLTYLRDGNYELEVATRRVPCELRLGPLYDPSMSRVRA